MRADVRRADRPALLAAQLQQLRTAQPHLSQRKLAQELGISRSCYARYESGTRSPPAWVLARLAAYYRVDIQHFFQKEGNPNE